MNRGALLFFVTTLTILFFAVIARATAGDVPAALSAPVVLYDEANNLLPDGQYDVVITLADPWGTLLYAEEQNVSVVRGIANIAIGEGYAVGSGFATSAGGLDYSLFEVEGDVSVEILVAGQANPQELAILGSQPYAFVSQYAHEVRDNAVTSAKIRDGAVTADDLDPVLLEELQHPVTIVTADGSDTVTPLTARNVAVDGDIGLNNASGTTVHDVLRGLDGAIDTVRGADIASLDEDVDDLGSRITNVASDLDELSGEVTNVAADLDALTGEVTTVASDLDELTGEVTNVASDLDELTGEVTNVASDLDELTGEVTTVASDLTNLGNNVSALDTGLDGLTSTVNGHVGSSAGVHGISGSVVGTSDAQTLTNKTLGGATVTGTLTVKNSDIELYSGYRVDGVDVSALDASVSAHAGDADGVHGTSGDVVGTGNTQTLSNKTLDGVSLAGPIAMNGNNITGLARDDGSGSFDVTSLEGRVATLEAEPQFSESDISQALKPFAFGTAVISGGSVASCSGYNIKKNETGRCAFDTSPLNTNYVVVSTPSASYRCTTVSAWTFFWFYVTKDSTASFNIYAVCDGVPSSNPTQADFIVYSEQ